MQTRDPHVATFTIQTFSSFKYLTYYFDGFRVKTLGEANMPFRYYRSSLVISVIYSFLTDE